MKTYLGMTAPIAAAAVVSWLRHPFKDSAEVAVRRFSPKEMLLLLLLTALVTRAFYYILRAFGTANLAMSTLSVTTSFLGASLMFLINDLYGYAAWRQMQRRQAENRLS